MKNQLAIGLGILVVLILLGGIFSISPNSHLPRAKTAHPTGTLILKDQLIFAGYKTPEAALESMFWAFVNGNYAAAVASVPENQAVKQFGNDPAKFKAESKDGEFADFASLQIVARKNLGADKVELEFQVLDKDENSNESKPSIASMMKVGNDWKLDFSASSDYTTNWDKGGNVETFAVLTHSPSTNRPGSFISQYKFGTGISIARKRLADVGYGTPEDAFETYNWAYANTNYDRMIGSFTPEIQKMRKAVPNGREHFEAQMSKFGFSTKTIHIAAKKMIADDRVELMISTEQGQKDSTFVSISVEQMVKVGDEWKMGGSKNYDAAWENGSQPEQTIQR